MTDGVWQLPGPKVQVYRGDTADAGGGQLTAVGADLLVQGPVRARKLGPLGQLSGIRFKRGNGKEAVVDFHDGSSWTIATDQGAALLEFAQQLQTQMGRPDLVTQAPSLQAQLSSLARERRLELLGLLGALVLLWLTRIAVGYLAALGYLLLLLALPWLALVAFVRGMSPGPAALSSIGRIVKQRSWVLTLALPVALLCGSLIGLTDAALRAEMASRDEAAARAAAAIQARAEQRQAAAAAERRARAEALLAGFEQALSEGRTHEAQELHAEAKAADPSHPKLKPAWARLAPHLEKVKQQDRAEAIRTGLAAARAVVGNKVRCESAQAVSEAWQKLRQFTPEEAGWEEALELTEKLERCRARSARILNRSAADALAQRRLQQVALMEGAARSKGHDVRLRATGSGNRVVRAELGERAAEAVVALSGEGKDSMLERLSGAGVRRVVFAKGKRVLKEVKLKANTDSDLDEVLAGLGLEAPLALPGAPDPSDAP